MSPPPADGSTTPVAAAPASRWVALLVLAVGLLLTALVVHLDLNAQAQLWRVEAVAAAEKAGRELRYRVLGERTSLIAAATLYFGSEAVTADELREAVEVIRRSKGRQRAPQLAWLQHEHDGGFRIAQSSTGNGLLPVGTLLQQPAPLLATLQLAAEGAPALQIGELFVHEGRSLLALAVAAPNRGAPGVLVEILAVDALLADVGEGLLREGMHLQISHPRSPGIDHAGQSPPSSAVLASHTQLIDMGAYTWTLGWQFDERFAPRQYGPRAVLIALIGLLLSASLAWVLHTTLGKKREVEREVQRQRAQLEATYAELHAAMKLVAAQERMAALGQLVAGVAHELNTPIGNALLAASTLDERSREIADDLAAKRLRQSALHAHLLATAEAAQLVQHNLERAAGLVHGFKQVAVDRASERRRRFDLAETVGEVVATLAPQLRGTPHRIAVDIPPGIVMHSFPGPLGQVLSNLIANSLKHGFADGRAGTIRISAEPLNPGRVLLRHADDGVGIDERVRGRVFDPFFTTRLGDGGSGLGLHIARNLVQDVLGGSIRCEPGDPGALFVLELPLRAPEHVGDASG